VAIRDLDALHAVPPGEFTAARNRLAARLRQAGQRADADAVARLRKPSAALWAVNQLARSDAAGVRRLTEAVDALRRAQLRDPRAAGAALRAQREALQWLVDRAHAVLDGAGLSASPALLRRVGDTLMGAATDRAQASALRRGILTEELPAPGFEAFGGARVPARPLRLVREPEPPAARSASADARDSRRAEAAARAERLEREASEAQATVSGLEREREGARAALTALDARLAQARRSARRAAVAAGRARREAAAAAKR
jgi:hypothetical protein